MVRRIFLAALVLGAVALAAVHFHYGRKIKKRLAELRAAGVPITLADATRAHREWTSGSNAASAYVKLFRDLTNVTSLSGSRALFASGYETNLPAISGDERAKWTRLLEQNQRAYDQIPGAIATPQAFYQLAWEDGANMALHNEAKTGELIRLINLHARFAFEAGQTSTVLDDIEFSVRVGDSLAAEPLVLSSLIRTRGHENAARIALALLNSGKLAATDLERLAKIFAREDLRRQWQSVLGLERSMGEAFFARPFGSGLLANGADMEGIVSLAGVALLQISGMWKRDRLFYLEQIRGLELAAVAPDAERRRIQRQLEAAEDRTRSLTRVGSSLLLPGLHHSFAKQLSRDANIRLTRAAIALRQHSHANSGFPEHLAALVPKFLPAVPADPYTGEPIKYRREEKGCVLYSVGPDERDDNGKPIPKTVDPRGDIVVRLVPF